MRVSAPHFHVTAGLVWKDGKLLITRRPEGSHLAGYWEFPGGKQESGESLEACLEREFREELAMEVKAVKHLQQIDHAYETKSITLHLFQCDWLSGTPTPIGCDALRWVKPEELAGIQLPPPDFQLLPLIQELAKGGGDCSRRGDCLITALL
ncbi:MAG: (deoxy)nucleoside triphosphate pyrophosphohydrolase [Desulfobacterota bacterium]|jgi:mutator protein MutT|nr:(deoxy)nucleoside triphosphate pyrophosphohydrolase [Thermodesulfobacteriota bacterium]